MEGGARDGGGGEESTGWRASRVVKCMLLLSLCALVVAVFKLSLSR